MPVPAIATKFETALANGDFSGADLPMPFIQEVFLMKCHIAGTSYQDLDDVAPELNKEELLLMRREPKNRHDQLAIEILTQEGVKLGYVPQVKNEVLARLMDAGKMMFAKVMRVWDLDGWLRIDIEVYLKDV